MILDYKDGNTEYNKSFCSEKGFSNAIETNQDSNINSTNSYAVYNEFVNKTKSYDYRVKLAKFLIKKYDQHDESSHQINKN